MYLNYIWSEHVFDLHLVRACIWVVFGVNEHVFELPLLQQSAHCPPQMHLNLVLTAQCKLCWEGSWMRAVLQQTWMLQRRAVLLLQGSGSCSEACSTAAAHSGQQQQQVIGQLVLCLHQAHIQPLRLSAAACTWGGTNHQQCISASLERAIFKSPTRSEEAKNTSHTPKEKQMPASGKHPKNLSYPCYSMPNAMRK